MVQAILSVLGGVAVDHIQKHHESHWMGHIYQLFQLIWGTVPAKDKDMHRCVLDDHNLTALNTIKFFKNKSQTNPRL